MIYVMSPTHEPLVDIPNIPERPLAFTCPKPLFVDRQLIIDRLYHIALRTPRRVAKNQAIIGPRRIGKSAIFDRLYNHLWSHQREVIPLYFSFRAYAGKPALDTLTRMGRAFLTQYFSFLSEHGMPSALTTVDHAHKMAHDLDDEGVLKALAQYTRAIEVDSEIEILEKLADLPRTIADTNDCSIVVFIDEFQVIMQMLDRDKEVTDLRATFKGAVESPRCTFFVTGSAVTIMREQIMSRGPLFGRLRPMHIGPLEEYWGIDLVARLAEVHDLEMPPELAAYLVEYTNAHPYYIHCFMGSVDEALLDARNRHVTRELLSTAISTEETEGELSNFFEQLLWGFIQDYKPIAWVVLGFIAEHGEEEPIDHGMLYQFLENVKDEIPWLAKYANLETAMQLLADLTEADIVEANGLGNSLTGPYRFGKDPVLKRYIQLMYEHEVGGRSLDMVQDSEMERLGGQLQDLKRMLGYLLESHVKYLMLLWDGREVSGVFGSDEEVVLPAFTNVYDTMVKAVADRAYQIDVYGFTLVNGRPAAWAAECRYRNRKAGRKDVEKFAAALDALKEDRNLTSIHGWFISIEGFTEGALEALEEHGVYYSNKNELNALLEAFGLRTIAI